VVLGAAFMKHYYVTFNIQRQEVWLAHKAAKIEHAK
jgi:hypothetical protein